jgi:hypothetical protein
MFAKPTSKKKIRGQGIVKVASLFEKYKKVLRAPQKTVIAAFVAVVHEMLHGVHLREDQCTYSPSSRILSVRVSGMIKTEIQFKKKQILAQLEEVLGEKSSPKDIL